MNYFNYYTEIEETFVRRRGKNLLLSPIDWALIEGWQQRGIPLHVAVRAIESVFDGYDKKPSVRAIKGLLYCREEIEVQFDEWLRSQAGKADDSAAVEDGSFSAEQVSSHINDLIASLQKLEAVWLREDLERVSARLEGLNANLGQDFEHVDKSLADIEHFLDNSLLTNSDKTHLRKIETEVAEQLKAYKAGMDDEAYSKTFELMLLKRLREEYKIPRLTLFYL
ncbi:MAG TPA: hypothetical protein VL572_02875 [Pyrinomonadaceae bacterium]|nr:hypothetical protein [Pyrinomonadaceae bacterium]